MRVGKMRKFLLAVFFCASLVQSDKKKVSLADFDTIEINKITKYNETRMRVGLAPIFFSKECMNLAISEASALAKSQDLAFPRFKTKKHFRGYSLKITEIVNKKKYGREI
jgi:hypothetical protein